ncbi:MAG: DUF4142 domain-containing protein [Proteobacteria bacterium]|nr:DUF4142 domain-containing protein [Pseudomonadota bacterium]MBS0573882.1 DUF4142 domain-containing protein [Pseudomonadota bacterium]
MNRTIRNVLLAALVLPFPALAESPADLNDAQMADVAYVADNIDIRQAHLALALSDNADVRAFADTMIADHTAVNEQALALLKKLGVKPEDNFLSQQLLKGAADTMTKLSALRGADFDRAYAANELAYHKTVNGVVGDDFIPHAKNAQVKALFEAGLKIFKAHEKHAEKMVAELK